MNGQKARVMVQPFQPPLDDDCVDLPAPPEVLQTEVGLLENFCELLFCPETRKAAVVDPAFEVDRLLRLADEKALTIETILITHTHHDHVDGLREMAEATGATTVIHPHELDRIRGMTDAVTLSHDRMDIAIGHTGVRALECFGHTVGGVVYLADGFVISNDVLFVGGCGRSDLQPGGDTENLWKSLQRLTRLPEETKVYPGHNYGSTPTSSIGREMLENPYLQCSDLASFKALRERRR